MPGSRECVRVVQCAGIGILVAALASAGIQRAAKRRETLWRDPGNVARLDFAGGPGGRSGSPRPPFQFVKEDASGSSPKVFVRDAAGRDWNVKFGPEVKPETFASRVAWAAGYFVEPMYFVPAGRLSGVASRSRRAAAHVADDGHFANARFQLRDPRLRFMERNDWSWSYNPFVGTRELAGLKIVIMLTSNWDNKDARDVDEGSNTAIFRQGGGRAPRYIYAFTDWGQSMGRWGNALRRSGWNCADFAGDTPGFVRRLDNGRLEWGYAGRHTGEFAGDVRPGDIAWLLRYAGSITGAQFRAGLLASGATPDEADCFTRELQSRIGMLRAVAREAR